MQSLPSDEVHTAFTLGTSEGRLDNSTIIRFKKKIAAEFKDQLTIGAPTNEDEAGLRRLSHQLKTKKLVIKLGYRFFSKDEKQILQVRLDGFTFSRLAPYDCWQTFRDEAKRLWSIYQELTHPEGIARLAVRYINRLDIPLPVNDFKDYLRTFPEVSSDLPQGLSGYFMQLQIPQQSPATTCVLNQALVPSPVPELVSILLDLDLFLEKDIPNNEIGIWKILEQMHEQKNKAFEACITERTRELIK